MRRDDRRVPVDLSAPARPEPLLQHPCRRADHPRAGSSRPPGIRRGAARTRSSDHGSSSPTPRPRARPSRRSPARSCRSSSGSSEVGGSSGCNTFQGTYTQNGNLVRIGPLATTRMACPENVMAQETAFLAALQGVGRIDPRGQRLKLTDLGGSVVVSLIRPSAIPVPAPSPSASPSAPPSAPPTAVTDAGAAVAERRPSPRRPARPPRRRPRRPRHRRRRRRPSRAAPRRRPSCRRRPCRRWPNCALGASTIVYPALVHRADALDGGLPVLQRGADHHPARSGDARHGRHDRPDPAASYAEALTAATNPTAWNVADQRARHAVGAARDADRGDSRPPASRGCRSGTTRYGYLIDVTGKGVWIETAGLAGDAGVLHEQVGRGPHGLAVDDRGADPLTGSPSPIRRRSGQHEEHDRAQQGEAGRAEHRGLEPDPDRHEAHERRVEDARR